MNNHRLLTGLLVAALLGGRVCAVAETRRVMTIEELFETAESNSAQLRPSFAAEEEARREVSVARSKWLPEINASLSLSYLGDGFTTRRDLSDRQKAPIPHFGNGLAVTVSQPLYSGGAIENGVRLARLRQTASSQTVEMRRDNLRFLLAGYYLDIYKYANLREVVAHNMELAAGILAEMKARHDQGVVLLNDITRYELLLSDLQLQTVRIDNTLDILNRNLTVTAGLPDDMVVIPDSTILDRSLPSDGEEWWQSQAAANSPALKLARSEVDISRRAEKLVKSDRLPKIGLQAGWTIDGPILVEIPPVNRNLSYWYVGVGVTCNLSSLYKNNRSLAKSRAATVRAVGELDVARDRVGLEVRDAYIRYLEAYEVLKTRRKSVELADMNYKTVSTRYLAGMALVTDMLDAANASLDAGQQLVNARIDIIYYYYKLLFTSGKI